MSFDDVSTDDSQGTVAFTVESAQKTLTNACKRVGLKSAGARLLRLGENAVFQLHQQPVVVRIARTNAYLPEIETGVRVARWLAEVDFPAVRAVPGVEQALTVDRRVVTFWESLSDQYATVADLAVLLRDLHALQPPASLRLSAVQPLLRTSRRIESAAIDQQDKQFLTGRVRDLTERWNALSFALPCGMVHGDASIGNIIYSRDHKPVLIDLDSFSIGPREWDLTLTALYYERFGWHTREEYEQFATLYGFDVMTSTAYPVLRAIRETIMVGWLSQNIGASPEIAAEVHCRIGDLRSSREGRLEWKPF